MADGKAERVDTGAAEAFERLLVPPIFGPWSRALVDLARPRAGERVIDIACGTGVAARTAMGLVGAQGAVAAVDIDAGMIAHAGTLEDAAAIDWRRADVMDLPFEDDAFDVALCNQGLQFFPDRIAALREIRRVLRSGARLATNTYCAVETCPAHYAVTRALEARGVDTAPILRPYSLAEADELRRLAAGAGFHDVTIERRVMESRFPSAPEFVASLAAGGPAARLALERLDADGLDSLKREVAGTLGGRLDADSFVIETTSHMMLAYA